MRDAASRMWEGWRLVGEGRPSDGLCAPGIIAVVDATTGKAYVAATTNMAKRLYDHRQRLRRGRHPCPNLQRDYSSRPSDFEFFVVQRVGLRSLLYLLKQFWIDRLVLRGLSYNRKNAIARRKAGRVLDGPTAAPPYPVRPPRSIGGTIGAFAKAQETRDRHDLMERQFSEVEAHLRTVRRCDPSRAVRKAKRALRRANELLAQLRYDGGTAVEARPPLS